MKVEISLPDGRITVPGDKAGPFAIHRTPSVFGWTLTHLATGYSLARCLRERETAARLAASLEPMLDWSFDSPSAVAALPEAVRARIRGVIRGFKRDDQLGRFATPQSAEGGNDG